MISLHSLHLKQGAYELCMRGKRD